MPIVLKVYDGGTLSSSRSFDKKSIELGSASTDLLLEAAGVEPCHAVIDARASGLVLRAAGDGEVFLNGQPIIAAPLRHGDHISIAGLRIVVELEAQVAAPAETPEGRKGPHLHLVQAVDEPQAPVLTVVPDLPGAPHAGAAPVHTGSVRTEAVHAVAPVMAAPVHAHAPVAQAAVQVAAPKPAAPKPLVTQPAPQLAAEPDALPVSLPKIAAQGGEHAEVELFWGDTRISVWQLLPGEELLAGQAPGCHALLEGLDKAAVVKSDANGWTVRAPRPLQLFLEEEGRTLAGPELLVRGRSQAASDGLSMQLPQTAVALLTNGKLALRVRRVHGVQRVGGEQQDHRGVLAAAVAAVLMMIGMKFWTASVPPPKSGGEAEVIRPRSLPVRAEIHAEAVKPQPEKKAPQNEGRRDPGKAVARHMGEEGMAGRRDAPRRDARAERKMDDRALVANAGLLKALGGGKGQSNVFGIALDKGATDAMGHLTGPRVGDARGDGGMGLKSLGGKGGGGDGSGLGLARIGTNGIGGGLANYGDGKGGLHGKENGEIGLGPGKPEVVGSIDPELIRKVVHEHRAQIRTCYETQLASKPALAGKIVAAWTIDQDGSVTAAKTQETTMHDHSVEDCVASRIKSWRFPIPKGGGEVFVTYPFIFTPGG